MKAKKRPELYCMKRTLFFEPSQDLIDFAFGNAVPVGKNRNTIRHFITLAAHPFILLIQVDVLIVIRFEAHTGQTFQDFPIKI